MIDISVVIPSSRPKSLAHVITYINEQETTGLNYELIIIQESNTNFDKFNCISYPIQTKIIRKKLGYDCGANARDIGAEATCGDYVLFWDDDNIYYRHAIVSSYLTALNNDIGITRVKHNDIIIPIEDNIIAGEIDSMCICTKSIFAKTTKWADGGGRYNDYRWISSLIKKTKSINYSKVIIGEHL